MVVLGGGLILMSEKPLYQVKNLTLVCQVYPNRLKLCIMSGSNDLHRVCPELAKRNSSSRSYTIKTRIVPENSFYHLEVITLNPEVIVTPDDDFMRTSSMIKHSGSVKINSRMDHISHCKTASG
jgi:hypothetical protein